jgi:hypothetical protein
VPQSLLVAAAQVIEQQALFAAVHRSLMAHSVISLRRKKRSLLE